MYLILFIASVCLSLIYLILIIRAIYIWKKERVIDHDPSSEPFVSIVIVARNEAANISACLQSIATNEYPIDRYEIVLMDDHSEDGTITCAESLNISNLSVFSLSNYDLSAFDGKYKKAGLYWAIQETKHNYILQTDGDCICPSSWVREMAKALKHNDVVTGPILMDGSNSLLSQWQTYDIMGTMALTYLGSVTDKWHSANGANMGYKKELFQNFHLSERQFFASGDDIFLINWAHHNGYATCFIKSPGTIVSTTTEKTPSALFNQRLRWATKTTAYQNHGLKWLMLGLFLFHFTILLAGLGGLISGGYYVLAFAILIGAKWIGDTLLLYTVAGFFKRQYPLILGPILSILHTCYVVVIGWSGLLLKKYEWKGRKVR